MSNDKINVREIKDKIENVEIMFMLKAAERL